MSLSDQDRQAMIRAYAEIHQILRYEWIVAHWEEIPEHTLWEQCWLTAMRYGMGKAQQACQAHSRLLKSEAAQFGARSCAAAITAAMPAKEGE